MHICINPKSEIEIKNIKRLNLLKALIEKYEIIHFFRSQDIIFSRFLKAHKKFFTNMMGLNISKKDIYHRFLYKNIDKIFAISNAVKKELEENLPVGKGKIILLYPGIDTEYFKKNRNLREKFRKEFNIKENEIVLSMTSRFDPLKGQREAIEAFKIIKKEFKNVKLFLKGAVENKKYFEELKKLNVPDVYFLNFSHDVRELLCGSDIFLFPSHSEALGFSLLEAMSSELPCVAFSERAVPEIIDNEKDGFLVNNKNLNEFVKRTILLIKNKNLRKEIGRNAREKIIEKFNIENYIEKLINFYSQ